MKKGSHRSDADSHSTDRKAEVPGEQRPGGAEGRGGAGRQSRCPSWPPAAQLAQGPDAAGACSSRSSSQRRPAQVLQMSQPHPAAHLSRKELLSDRRDFPSSEVQEHCPRLVGPAGSVGPSCSDTLQWASVSSASQLRGCPGAPAAFARCAQPPRVTPDWPKPTPLRVLRAGSREIRGKMSPLYKRGLPREKASTGGRGGDRE